MECTCDAISELIKNMAAHVTSRGVSFYFFTSFTSRSLNHPSSRNPRALSIKPQRNCEKSKNAHQHAKYSKWLCGAPIFDPVRHEKRPCESDDGAHDGNNDETVS